LDEDIDRVELQASIKELALYELNGRQIRNFITTARQLALFKKESLNSGHMKRVYSVSAKFDDYISEIKDGVTDEEYAREDRRR
jgi:hypothetical protein